MIAEVIVGLLVAILIPTYFAKKHPWTLYAAPVGVAIAVYNQETTKYFMGLTDNVGEFGAVGLQALLFGLSLYVVDTVNNMLLTPLQRLEREVEGDVRRIRADVDAEFNRYGPQIEAGAKEAEQMLKNLYPGVPVTPYSPSVTPSKMYHHH